VALDIDGTSGDYHGHFTWFAELYTGKKMPDPKAYTGGVPFHKHLGVSRSTYNTMKLAYRQGGFKRSMPAYEGIGEFTRHVRRSNVQLWICTTRPYLRLDNIDPDTRHWLRRNGLQHDAVLYGPHKYRDLVRAVGAGRVLLVIDDLPAMLEQAAGLGLTSVLRSQPYNTYWDSIGKAHRVDSVDGYRKVFDHYLEWRA
jgi:hypothetical protein